MRHPDRLGATRADIPAAGVILAVLSLILSAPSVPLAQQPPAEQQAADPERDDQTTDDAPLTFLDEVTVSATLRPAPVVETPGMVTVIDSETIQGRMLETFADLVKYEPGVYVENHVTRLGLNGFNIRGIGRNRVMTQVDGVQTSEQFDFGPFNIHQVGLDIDALRSVEIVRSANSALYGSDALGGVVSLFTKDPVDYLGSERFYVGAKTTWDGRANDASLNLTLAGGNDLVQSSVFLSANRGGEIHNRGTVGTMDDTRTLPNPQDARGMQVLAKFVYTPTPGNMWRVATELYDSRVETEWYSDRGMANLGFLRYTTVDSDAVDTQNRRRYSLDHTLVGRGLDQLSWSVYGQTSDTAQIVDRHRLTSTFGPPTPSHRHGTVNFEQAGHGAAAQGQHRLGGVDGGVRLTFGASYKKDRFDMLRDRTETNTRTGAPVPTRLLFPDKYFPRSNVFETGSYVQAEFQFDRVTLVPGVRYDHFALDAEQRDPVLVANGKSAPADFSDGAMSPKLGAAVRITDVVTVHAQFASGFRAPPYDDINTGFANPAGGYTALPNPELMAERSDNVEFGVRTAFGRASFEVTGFANRFDNFIELTSLGFNPRTRLLEFQSQNLEKAEINGVELRAEAYLTGNVLIRGSYARIDGVEIVQGATQAAMAEETPLQSIAPNEGVIGIRYVEPSGLWTTELSVRLVESYEGTPDQNQFEPDAYQVVDLVGSVSLAADLTLRLGLLNLTNSKYFEWSHVRGRQANDPLIDRYSSPGASFVGSLGYDW